MKPTTVAKLKRNLRATLHAQLDELLDGRSDNGRGQSVLEGCVQAAQAGGVTFQLHLNLGTSKQTDA